LQIGQKNVRDFMKTGKDKKTHRSWHIVLAFGPVLSAIQCQPVLVCSSSVAVSGDWKLIV